MVLTCPVGFFPSTDVCAVRYFYQFNFTMDGGRGQVLRDFHSAEQPYVWNDPKAHWTPADHEMAETMNAYWACFATTHFLGGEEATRCPGTRVVWPPWEPTSEFNLAFDQPVVVQQGVFEDHCDMWDRIGYNF